MLIALLIIARTAHIGASILLVGNGGSVLFYVIGHEAALVHRLVEFLQQSDFAAVIFTKQGSARNLPFR